MVLRDKEAEVDVNVVCGGWKDDGEERIKMGGWSRGCSSDCSRREEEQPEEVLL